MTTTFQNTDISNNAADAITLNSGDKLIVGTGVNVDYTGSGFFAGVGSSTGGVTITNAGTIAGVYGIKITGDSNTITNTASGTIIGTEQNAIKIDGASSSLTNAGSIIGYLYFTHGSNTVSNSGAQHGGVQFSFSDNLLTNTGTIENPNFGVMFGASGLGFNTVYNYGVITSTLGASVDLGGGGGLIVNNGTLSGYVLLGNGAATLNNNGFIYGNVYGSLDTINLTNTGTIFGNVTLSDVNDVFDGSRGKVTGLVDAGNGNDSVTGGAYDDALMGGGGNDNIKGGGGDDALTGGLGTDKLTGGGGEDSFVYTDKAESTGKTYDTVVKFDTGDDVFDLNVGVAAIDAPVASGTLNGGATFNTDLATAVGAGQLAAHHAVLFTATAGGLAGHTFLIVDVNGAAGYQSAKDYVIELKNPLDLAHLSTDNFI
jgi:Ca2+-binding RTX toxin-like protein